MNDKGIKQFHNGREVLEAYVPGYRSGRSNVDPAAEREEEIAEKVQDILAGFGNRILAAQERPV